MVEQQPFKLTVTGSTPVGGTKNKGKMTTFQKQLEEEKNERKRSAMEDRYFYFWGTIAFLILLAIIIIGILLYASYESDNFTREFKAATEAGLEQCQNFGSRGWYWAKDCIQGLNLPK